MIDQNVYTTEEEILEINWETEMLRKGVEGIEAGLEGTDIMEGVGSSVVMSTIREMAQQIAEEQARIVEVMNDPAKKDKRASSQLFLALTPEALAAAAVPSIMRALYSEEGSDFRALITRISEEIKKAVHLDRWENGDAESFNRFWRKYGDLMSAKDAANLKVKKSRLKGAMTKALEGFTSEDSDIDAPYFIDLATRLVEMFGFTLLEVREAPSSNDADYFEIAGDICEVQKTVGTRHDMLFIVRRLVTDSTETLVYAADGFVEALQRAADREYVRLPTSTPMLVKPLRWTEGKKEGGYFNSRKAMYYCPTTRHRFEPSESCLKALNVIQETKWSINEDAMRMMDYLQGGGSDGPMGFNTTQPAPVARMTAEERLLVDPRELADYRQAAKQYVSDKSRRAALESAIAIANKLR